MLILLTTIELKLNQLKLLTKKKEWIEQDKTPITTFLKDYNITDDVTDFIKSKDIQDWIDEKKLGISMTKFGMELNKYVVIHKLENVETKNKNSAGK